MQDKTLGTQTQVQFLPNLMEQSLSERQIYGEQMSSIMCNTQKEVVEWAIFYLMKYQIQELTNKD